MNKVSKIAVCALLGLAAKVSAMNQEQAAKDIFNNAAQQGEVLVTTGVPTQNGYPHIGWYIDPQTQVKMGVVALASQPDYMLLKSLNTSIANIPATKIYHGIASGAFASIINNVTPPTYNFAVAQQD
jgi:hypothetical protein